mmetsp:Transcript_55887/g.141531  ORF Transcript_55887/g.141531 Transcript_55887/m.141531 type:complete len:214 (+) Transcript_55887:70-711(+)
MSGRATARNMVEAADWGTPPHASKLPMAHAWNAVSLACEGAPASTWFAAFELLCSLSSPGEQAWQCSQAWQFWQPAAFQSHAQGLHLPIACKADPFDGKPSSGGTSSEKPSSGRPSNGGLSSNGLSSGESGTLVGSGTDIGDLASGLGSDWSSAVAALHIACTCMEANSMASWCCCTAQSECSMLNSCSWETCFFNWATLVFRRSLMAPSGHE